MIPCFKDSTDFVMFAPTTRACVYMEAEKGRVCPVNLLPFY
jgi:hypothetical protein